MLLHRVRRGRGFSDIGAAIRSLVRTRAPKVLCTGVEVEDRLISAIRDLKNAHIIAVPATEAARQWLLEQADATLVVRGTEDLTWHRDRYDVVACASPLQDAGPSLMEADWIAHSLLKSGGRLFIHGALPKHLEQRLRTKLPKNLVDTQTRLFDVTSDGMQAKPNAFAAVDFLGWCPRKPGTQSHVGWLAFSRRRQKPHSVEPCNALRLGRGLEAVLERVPAFELSSDLVGRRFDRVVFVSNSLTEDPRVARALQCADSPSGRALGVGRTVAGAAALNKTPALVLLPDHREQIGRRLRLAGISRDRPVWRELTLAATGRDLDRLMKEVGAPKLVLHTHDMDGVIVGALAGPTAVATGGGWVHDVHEYAAGYDAVIDAKQDLAQAALTWEKFHLPHADAVVTVSPLLGEKLSALYGLQKPPHVILNSIDDQLAEPYTPCLRSMHGVDPRAALLLHVGSVRPGRGIETVLEALKHLPKAHLLCVGSGTPRYLADLMKLATEGGVKSRFHLHGHVDSRFLISLSQQADIGLIPMDSYGNSEVSLPNKLFVYIAASLPVVSTATAEMARFMAKWPIGRLCAPGDSLALAQAVVEVLHSRPAYEAAFDDKYFRNAMSWQAQCLELTRVYNLVSADGPPLHVNRTAE